MAALRGGTDWEAELRGVRDPDLALPDYYTQPFHAYRDGNLCWEAALQVIACRLLRHMRRGQGVSSLIHYCVQVLLVVHHFQAT